MAVEFTLVGFEGWGGGAKVLKFINLSN